MATRKRRAGVSKERAIIMKIQEWWKSTTLGQRAMLTVGIVVAVLLAMALYGYMTGAWDADTTEHTYNTNRAPPFSGLESRT